LGQDGEGDVAVPVLPTCRNAAGAVIPVARGRCVVAVDVVTEIVIDRPCAVVAECAGDPSHAPRWHVNIESVEWRTPAPVAVAAAMRRANRKDLANLRRILDAQR
jgi:hypothetical protein